MLITKHLTEKQSAFAVYDNYRSIASFVDGLKPSTRKVVHCAKTVKDFAKVDALANIIAGKTLYMHGSVNLEGVIKGMAQTFAGTNNLPLLVGEGYFGYRDEQITGASRYTRVKQSNALNYICRKEDDPILIGQEFEGDEIEYKYYLPIIPLVLVNGSEGIGQGFAHKILARNPKEVIQYIINELDGKTNSELLPFYKGFKTQITPAKDKQFNVIGALEVVNTSTINITELPFTYDSAKYIKILNELEDEGIIRSYKDRTSKNNFMFELKVVRAAIMGKSEDELLSMFKLKTTITENYTLLDTNNKIRIFDNVYQIMDEYIKIRLDGYVKRKEYKIKEIKHDIAILENKSRFINEVNQNLIILKQSKKELISNLEICKFDKVEGTYDYLFSITALQFSNEKVQELNEQISKLKTELELYKQKDIKDIWKEELKELSKVIGETIKTDKVEKQPKKKETYEEVIVDTKDILSLF